MNIEIIDRVKVPKDNGTRCKWQELIRSLKSEQAIKIECADKREAERLRLNIMGSFRRERIKHDPSAKPTTRIYHENGKVTLYIWRGDDNIKKEV